MRRVTAELDAIRQERGKEMAVGDVDGDGNDDDHDEDEKENEMNQAIEQKMGSLENTLGRLSGQIANLRGQFLESTTNAGKVASAEIERKREEFLHEASKVGAVMETMQDQWKQKLKLAKRKAERVTYEITLGKEKLKRANEYVSKAQDGYNQRQSEIDKVRS